MVLIAFLILAIIAGIYKILKICYLSHLPIKCQLYLPLVCSLFLPADHFLSVWRHYFNISAWKRVNSWLSRPGCLKSRTFSEMLFLRTGLWTLQRDELWALGIVHLLRVFLSHRLWEFMLTMWFIVSSMLRFDSWWDSHESSMSSGQYSKACMILCFAA